MVMYDTNIQLLPVIFGHLVYEDSYDTWQVILVEIKRILGSDVAERTTIVDSEKLWTRHARRF